MAKTSGHTKQEIWFPAKTYGWGWGLPVKWQGWVALVGCLTVGFVPLMLAIAYSRDDYCQKLIDQKLSVSCNPQAGSALFIMSAVMWFVCWVLILFIISNFKGEKPSWRWGSKKHSKPESAAAEK